MNLTINNVVPMFSADPTALGAAIKIIVAGGSTLDDDAQRRASGCSPHVWTRKREETIRLVLDFETS